MLKIGTLELKNWLIMAPMAGITSLPFRLMVKKQGVGLVTTEMVSSMGLTVGNKKSFDYLKTHPGEKPLAVQIFGSNPVAMARAAQICHDAGADLIDINMGCPVKKVVKTGAGAALLRNPKKVSEIVTAVRLSCPIPLTVKIRAGWNPQEVVAADIARIAEDCGADAVTVHSRFASQSYSVPADWAVIADVKKRVTIPVIGNGDVTVPHRALSLKRQTGCDGVMIGRGAVGNPWIFHQINCLAHNRRVPEPDLMERRSFVMEHFRLLSDFMGERRAALSMRGLLFWYTKGLPQSARFRNSISDVNDFDSLVSTMDHFFSGLKEKEN